MGGVKSFKNEGRYEELRKFYFDYDRTEGREKELRLTLRELAHQYVTLLFQGRVYDSDFVPPNLRNRFFQLFFWSFRHNYRSDSAVYNYLSKKFDIAPVRVQQHIYDKRICDEGFWLQKEEGGEDMFLYRHHTANSVSNVHIYCSALPVVPGIHLTYCYQFVNIDGHFNIGGANRFVEDKPSAFNKAAKRALCPDCRANYCDSDLRRKAWL